MTFAPIVLGLMPSFLLIGLGGLLRFRLSDTAWLGLDRLNFEILFPALLFVAAAERPIAVADVAIIGPVVWLILTAGLGLGWLARRYGPEKFLDFAGCWQLAYRFNTAIGFVAAATLDQAAGTASAVGLMAIVAGMAVPVANIFAVTALSRGHDLGFAGTARKVALNPFLLASLGGVAVGISGFSLPAPLLAPLKMLAQAAIPVALISIGATMAWSAMGRPTRFGGFLGAIKLVALPGLTAAACWAVGWHDPIAATIIVFAALPTSSAAHVLAAGFGADRELVATLIAQSTAAGAVTLPVWIAVAAFFAG